MADVLDGPHGNVGLPTLIQRYGSYGLPSSAWPLAADRCDGAAERADLPTRLRAAPCLLSARIWNARAQGLLINRTNRNQLEGYGLERVHCEMFFDFEFRPNQPDGFGWSAQIGL
jgi:hypothetical protein